MAMQIASFRTARFPYRALTEVLARWRGRPVSSGALNPSHPTWFRTAHRYVDQGQAVLDRLATLAQRVRGFGWAGWHNRVSDTDRLRLLPETFQTLDETRVLFRQQLTELATGRAVWLNRRGGRSSGGMARQRTSYLAVMVGVLNFLETTLVISSMEQIRRCARKGPFRRSANRRGRS
jgi:hypothetical protein